jgi:hypothetical protein
MPWWDNLGDYAKSAYNWSRKPLLPKIDPRGEEKTWQSKLEKFYNETLQPMSDPLTAGMMIPSYATAGKGVGKMLKAGVKGIPANVPKAQRGIYKAGADDVNRAMYGSILSAPESHTRANLGAIGGTSVAMGMLAREKKFKEMGELAKDVIFPTKNYRKRFKEGFLTPGRVPRGQQTVSRSSWNPIDLPTRIMGALDNPYVSAMEKAGIDLNEAKNLVLTGKALSKSGKRTLGYIESIPQLKLLVPFARVGIIGLEQATLNKKRLAASAAIGGGAFAAGDKIPSEYASFASAAAGPLTVPAAGGFAARHAYEAGKDWLPAFSEEMGRNLPLPIVLGKDPTRLVSPETLSGVFTPNLLKDIAKGEDKWERDTRGVSYGRTKTKIPSLRQQLDTKGPKVNIFGKSVSGREDNVLKRMFTSEPYRHDPTPDTPTMDKLEGLGVEIKPPRYEKKLSIEGVKIDMDPEERRVFQEERRRLLEPILDEIVNDPEVLKMDEASQREYIEMLIQEVDKIGREIARATILERKNRK